MEKQLVQRYVSYWNGRLVCVVIGIYEVRESEVASGVYNERMIAMGYTPNGDGTHTRKEGGLERTINLIEKL